MALDAARFRQAEEQLWKSVGIAPTEHQVELPLGATVRIQEVGQGIPLLFVHGTGSSGVNWAPLIKELHHSGGFRCIAMDRPGCGLSEPTNRGQAFATADEFNDYADMLVSAGNRRSRPAQSFGDRYLVWRLLRNPGSLSFTGTV